MSKTFSTIHVREGEENEFVELADNVTLELDDQGQVIGIEIEDAVNMIKSVPELLNACATDDG